MPKIDLGDSGPRGYSAQLGLPIVDPEDAVTQGLPWQPDFIEGRGRSRRLTFRQVSVHHME